MAWLRRLDGQTKAYALNPAILDAKLARAEGLVTLWDLPDILIGRSKGMPFDYVFPRSGTVVIDDAIGLVRGSRQPTPRARSSTLSGAPRASCWRPTRCSGCRPGTTCRPSRCPPGSPRSSERWWWPTWTGPLLARDGAAWMGYWDRHVRGTGRRRGSMSAFLRLDGLVKRFDGTVAVDDAVARVSSAGEMLALLGPSGSGKTTTLRLLAGFETPDAGRVLVERRGRDRGRAGVAPLRHGVPALRAVSPPRCAAETWRSASSPRGRAGPSSTRRVTRALALVDLAGFERAPHRPALGRPAAAGGARPRAGARAAGAAAR